MRLALGWLILRLADAEEAGMAPGGPSVATTEETS
jgi:hypothetical protein